ncbi:hypothetical protein [Cardinium endosymbiont of Philonthus spinipes]|uniref:hypothetical protein n=1 Tax=Cardinium endosymbiont of Philonthus spinipes TaxID=3077941 RepID=UPI00313E85C0
MVYKKIGDKIPSLSSLLLAGALFTAGKCKSGDPDSGVKDDPSMLEGDTSKPAGKQEEADNTGQKLSSHLAEAVQAFKRALINCSGLSHLAGEKKPLSYDLVDFKGKDNKEMAEKAKGLLISLHDENVAALAYPKGLKSAFAALQELVKKKAYAKYPYAYALSIREIPVHWGGLHGIYSDMVKKITSCMPQDSLSFLIEKVDALMKSANEIFVSSKEFADNPTKKHELLKGPRFVRLLNGRSRQGSSYPEVPILFNKPTLSKLWVKFKPEEFPKPDLDNARAGDVLNKRGAAILTWKVEGGENQDTMLPVVAIANHMNGADNVLKQKFKHVAGTDTDIVPNDCFETIATPTNNSGFNSQAAIVKENISFGQLFFSIFKGNSKGDCVLLEPSSHADDTVKVTTDNEKYQYWIDASQKELGYFADCLGKHINSNNELKELFVIPDVSRLEDNLLNGIFPDKPANSGFGAVPATQDVKDSTGAVVVQGKPGTLGQSSQSVQLLENILSVFSSNQITTGSPAQLLQKIGELAKLDQNSQALGADLTFEQRVCIGLAKNIQSASFLTDTSDGSAKNIVDNVTAFIQAASSYAILVSKSGTYAPTQNTKLIAAAIHKFDEQLKIKNNSASVSYHDLEKAATGFQIEQVRQCFISDCKALKGVIAARVEPLIERPLNQKVNYIAELPDVQGLSEAYYSNLDEVRKNYHNKEGK